MNSRFLVPADKDFMKTSFCTVHSLGINFFPKCLWKVNFQIFSSGIRNFLTSQLHLKYYVFILRVVYISFTITVSYIVCGTFKICLLCLNLVFYILISKIRILTIQRKNPLQSRNKGESNEADSACLMRQPLLNNQIRRQIWWPF